MPRLDFYFDVISPFSYIAFEALVGYESRLPAKINFKPAAIGPIFKSSGNSPPLLCPAKAKYVANDLLMLSKYWNVPFRHPSNPMKRMLGANTSKIQKFLVAVKLNQPADLRALMRGFWTRFFVEDKNIFDIEDIREVCAKLNISNVDKLIQQSEEQNIADKYRKYTNEAVESDAFGLPWMLLQNEGQKPKKFFGTDRLPILFNELGVKFDGPLNLSKL
ncbi:hypothetical protein M3Y94_00112800 [Aphelenchoides besseyi]|nr:hypothetical protein M3Y94_00112800 [Aphelenchoides besseyi]